MLPFVHYQPPTLEKRAMTSPRADILETLGIPDNPELSTDALAVTAAIYCGLAAPGRAATNAGLDDASKIIKAAHMTRTEVEDCKLLALKIWQDR